MIDRDNLEYNILLNNEFNEVYTDEMIEDALEQRRNKLDSESRPQISTDFSLQHNIEMSKKEEEAIIKRIQKSKDEKERDKKTIMDMPLKDILNKTTETTASFWEDYTIALIEAKHHYEKKYDLDSKDTTWSNFFMIHGIAFVEYMKTKDNILYIGIFLFIVALIIYLFNIVI